MKDFFRRERFSSAWVIAGLIGAILGCVVSLTFVLVIPTISSNPPDPAVPVMTVLAAPTSTRTPVEYEPSLEVRDPTATSTAPPASEGGFSLGEIVEVSGTEGGGLRFRSEPGIASSINFLGLENEVFEVREGPQEADGYTWWLLVNPYDPTQSGWAVANYLRAISAP